FSDINLKLSQLNAQLPYGAGPIQFNSNFGDTAALMLTVASPLATSTEIALRARSVSAKIEETRAAEAKNAPQPRVAIVSSFPMSVSPVLVRQTFAEIVKSAAQVGAFRDLHFFEAPGFVGVDVSTTFDDATLRDRSAKFTEDKIHRS